MTYHETVLLKESIDGLCIKPDGIYIDATFGGGGHSREILKRLKNGRLLAFDQDEDASVNAIDDKRFILIHANFRFLKNFLRFHHIGEVDGILADLGVSAHQIDDPERGFSTRFNAELDLRMNRKAEISARTIIAEYTAEELIRIFSEYGELDHPKKLADTIVCERQKKEIVSVDDLKNILERFSERGKENKFFAKVFQALRIEINGEMEALKDLLLQSAEVLKSGGRLSVISYHSLEDRLVKNFMRSGNFEGEIEKDFYGNKKVSFLLITRKPVSPAADELERNSRSRSAKLRIAEKI
jgi:16S rRNA (cytosine1402-N4)-methyltransferase